MCLKALFLSEHFELVGLCPRFALEICGVLLPFTSKVFTLPLKFGGVFCLHVCKPVAFPLSFFLVLSHQGVVDIFLEVRHRARKHIINTFLEVAGRTCVDTLPDLHDVPVLIFEFASPFILSEDGVRFNDTLP